jgi:hypothetical protein
MVFIPLVADDDYRYPFPTGSRRRWAIVRVERGGGRFFFDAEDTLDYSFDTGERRAGGDGVDDDEAFAVTARPSAGCEKLGGQGRTGSIDLEGRCIPLGQYQYAIRSVMKARLVPLYPRPPIDMADRPRPIVFDSNLL